MSVEPAITWSFVTTSPRRSMTNPEPSCWTFCRVWGLNGVACVVALAASVTVTTPGATAR
jgi:hypothetical protein